MHSSILMVDKDQDFFITFRFGFQGIWEVYVLYTKTVESLINYNIRKGVLGT